MEVVKEETKSDPEITEIKDSLIEKESSEISFLNFLLKTPWFFPWTWPGYWRTFPHEERQKLFSYYSVLLIVIVVVLILVLLLLLN